MNLVGSKAGRAVLLSLALSVRRCSRADQRSPKPFISKDAITTRKGKHFDPYVEMTYLLNGLSDLHGGIKTNNDSAVIMSSFVNKITSDNFGKYSHIITSPPYINAQDYFRNFKLELYILENLLPFTLEDIKEHFVGTERGALATEISKDDIEKHYSLVPQLRQLSKSSPRLSAVVHRYLCDMSKAFNNMKRCLRPKGVCVIVCGDNLIGGYRLRTWEILNTLLAERGFVLFDLFTDSIAQRMLPPKRAGHKGIIKEEIVSAFHLN
jgi:hypothetical protein